MLLQFYLYTTIRLLNSCTSVLFSTSVEITGNPRLVLLLAMLLLLLLFLQTICSHGHLFDPLSNHTALNLAHFAHRLRIVRMSTAEVVVMGTVFDNQRQHALAHTAQHAAAIPRVQQAVAVASKC